jgi:hypothetical protein
MKIIRWGLALILLSFMLVSFLPVQADPPALHSFLTKPAVASVPALGTDAGTSQVISWTPGPGTDYSVVRWATGDYPSDNASGNQGYYGPLSSANITGLSENTTTYYSIFGIAHVGSLWSCSTPAHLLRDYEGSEWLGMSDIFWNPAQEDALNPYLETATGELDTYLSDMSGWSWDVVTSPPVAPAVYFSVNSTQLSAYGDEAFRLVKDSNGVTITGKTARACRNGAYYLLDEKLGVKWLTKNWTHVPGSLTNLANCDEIHEPDFFWRQVDLSSYAGESDAAGTWVKRNRLLGAKGYWITHSYGLIGAYIPGWTTAHAMWLVHPEYFLGLEPGVGDWQLNPENSVVRTATIAYSEDILADTGGGSGESPDVLIRNAPCLSPRDGGGNGWLPETDMQDITDIVAGLPDYAADTLESSYPNALFSFMDYASYCLVPTGSLNSKVLAIITLAPIFNYGNMPIGQKILEFEAKGVHIGIYDYFYVRAWGDEPKNTSYWSLEQIKWLAAHGVGFWDAEGMDTWGSRGLQYFIASKLLWDSSLSVDDIEDSFLTAAFGNAASAMKNYYHQRGADVLGLASAFKYLNQAETLATGDAESLSRIRELECFTWYLWQFIYIGKANLSQSGLETLYTMMSQMRYTYMLNWTDTEGGSEWSIRHELHTRFPTPYPTEGSAYPYTTAPSQFQALWNFTPPSSGQIATWLAAGLSAFPSGAAEYVNVRDIVSTLEPLGDTGTAVLAPLPCWNEQDILVYSAGSENVTVWAKCSGGDGLFNLDWHTPEGMLIERWTHTGATDWISHNFPATSAGYYLIHANRYVGSQTFAIDVRDRPAATICDWRGGSVAGFQTGVYGSIEDITYYHSAPDLSDTTSQYFYVPAGTTKFTFGATVILSGHIIGSLYEPNLSTHHDFDFSTLVELSDPPNPANEITITSPTAGLWRLDITNTPAMSFIWFRGIPPFIWPYPEYLLVEAD